MEETLRFLITVDKDYKVIIWFEGKKLDLSHVKSFSFNYKANEEPTLTLEMI